jgi:hypothetical protein
MLREDIVGSSRSYGEFGESYIHTRTGVVNFFVTLYC